MKRILLGKFSQAELDQIIRKSSLISETGDQIDFLSRQFLGIDYAESTLIGDANTPEVFVINLEGVDCFTFIEYIETMRLSDSYSGFESNLKKVRYRSGMVDFLNRNHFFSDWKKYNRDFVDDVTEEIGNGKIVGVQKTLNEREDGTYFLPGIQPAQHKILYIPSGALDIPVFNRLRTGDYIGIYSGLQGLDVSHAGIIIKDRCDIFLRHASSQSEYRKVVDQDFKIYVTNKPGIIVLRPKAVERIT